MSEASEIPRDPAPDPDQLLAMAYADGELGPEERRAFEERMRAEPALAREVVQNRRLDLLAARVAGPEPMDLEWERLRREPGSRALAGLAWSLVFVGTLIGCGWLALEIARAELPLALRAALFGVLGGLLILFLLVLRARLRTLPYDPYTEVER